MITLGIDIGGSGIKAAPVDTATGEMTAPRRRLPTPEPSTPEDMARIFREITDHFQWSGPIGCGFPSVVRDGVILTAANIDPSWVGVNAAEIVRKATGCSAVILNDADAAGLAEMSFGAGRDYQTKGTVLVITIGTGIGSAIFTDGHLLRNTEFGHMIVRGKDAEWRASAAVRDRKQLGWKAYAKRVNEYLFFMERLFWPDLIIIGGGISKESKKFFSYLDTKAKLVPAQMMNNAGIVGAAMAAEAAG